MAEQPDFQRIVRDLERAPAQAIGSMPSFLQVFLFILLFLGFLTLAAAARAERPNLAAAIIPTGFILSLLGASAVKVANQWERAIVLRLGEFAGIRGPGLFFITPVIDRVRTVDTRVKAVDIPRQEAITRDNVPVRINGALFFRVAKVEDAVLKIQDFGYGISLLAQTALRDVVGGMTLDDLLSERDKIGKLVQETVEKEASAWGLEVTGIRLMDIDMPEDLKKIMSRQASAEREKRATITKAEGDWLAAENLAQAASVMAASPGAMQLRTLQTIDGLGPTASNTVVLAIPIEVIEMMKRMGGKEVELKRTPSPAPAGSRPSAQKRPARKKPVAAESAE